MTGYSSTDNVKHSEMEDALIHFKSAEATHDAAFTKLTMINWNLYMKINAAGGLDSVTSSRAMQPQGNGGNANNWSERGGGVKRGQPYAREKKYKPQWPTNPMDKIYNNKNYWWLHGYYTSDPHTSETCTRTMFGNRKYATWFDPMGGSKNNKARMGKKRWNRVGVDDQEHIKLTCNGTSYNGF